MICLKEKQKMSGEDRKAQREDEKPKHKIRAKVEHRFADLKVQMKGGTTRFIGLVRNNMNFIISCMAANLRLIAYQQMNLRKSVGQ
jgi:IS5 family transposase